MYLELKFNDPKVNEFYDKLAKAEEAILEAKWAAEELFVAERHVEPVTRAEVPSSESPQSPEDVTPTIPPSFTVSDTPEASH